MEENRENNTTISETTDAEEAVSAANEEPQKAAPETGHDAPAAAAKKRSVKKVLTALLDIIFVCIIAFGVMQYYADQFREQIDNIALEQARSALSDLSSMGISFSLAPVDSDIPKAEKYAWKDLRDGGGPAAMTFQLMMYNEDFPDVIKTGKSVRYLNLTRTVKVYVDQGESGEADYAGNVDVNIVAFYQNYVKKGMIYRADAEPNAALVSYIGSFVEAQEQQLFEDSFQLKDSSVDFYDETITIYYSWTNLRDEDANPMWSFSLSASQNGRELTQDYFNSETDSFSQLAPGCTGEYSITYYLHDTSSPVKLVVSNLYGDNLFADDRPGVEYEIKLTDGKTTSGSQSNSFSTGQSDSNGYDLYEQFQQDFNSGNYTIGDPGAHYSGEEVRDYRSYDSGEELAELTLHDFGGYGEVSFYALGEGELHYDVTLVDSYSCSGYTADYFQFSDYTGLQDLLVLRSGSSEWLVTWNAHHPDGAVYEYEP